MKEYNKDMIELVCSELQIPPYILLGKYIGAYTSLVLWALSLSFTKSSCKEFCTTFREIADLVGGNERKIMGEIEKLRKLGFLSTDKKGMPAKLYYTIYPKAVYNFLSNALGRKERITDETENELKLCMVRECEKEQIKEDSTEESNYIQEEYDEVFGSADRSIGTNTNKLASNVENYIEQAKRIVEDWNSGAQTQKCRAVVGQIAVLLKKESKEIDIEEIEKAVKRYRMILDDKNYFFSYKWGLKNFLYGGKYKEFLDDGEHWINYKNTVGDWCEKPEEERYNGDGRSYSDFHNPNKIKAMKEGRFTEYLKELSEKNKERRRRFEEIKNSGEYVDDLRVLPNEQKEKPKRKRI